MGAVLAAAQLAAFAAFPAQGTAKTSSSAVFFENDGDKSGWSLADGSGEISEINEDGNKWVRFTPSVGSTRMKYDFGDNKLKFEEGQKIVIEARLRADSADGRVAMHYNVGIKDKKVQYGDKTQTNAIGWNHLILWEFMGKGTGNSATFGYPNGTAGDNSQQTGLDWQTKHEGANMQGELKKENVFTVKTVWNTATHSASYYITDPSSTTTAATTDLGYATMSEYFENITMGTVAGKANYIELDYIKISVIHDNAKATLLGGGEDNEFVKAEKLDVMFSLPIDKDTLPGNITLEAEDGTAVEIESLDYDSDSRTVSIVPKTENHRLESGKYKIVIGDKIKTTAIYSDYTALGLPERVSAKADKLEFTYFASEPPQISGVPYIDGTAKHGEILTAEYNYTHADGIDEGDTQIKWYTAPAADGTYTYAGVDGKEFEIKNEHDEKYIKFEVTPKDEKGFSGAAVWSSAFAAPAAPIAENVVISGTFVAGKSVTIGYDYSDVNGDRQKQSEFFWYISDTADEASFKKLENSGKSLTITDDMNGKYIRAGVKPYANAEPGEGKEALSKIYGPVSDDLRQTTNLIKNSGFENGTTDGYSTSENGVIEAIEDADTAYSGNWCMKVTNRSGASDGWGYEMTFEKDTAYLVSLYAKRAKNTSGAGYTTYAWGPGKRPTDWEGVDYPNALTLPDGSWHEISGILVGVGGAKVMPTVTSFNDFTDMYIDDMYVGKLEISDITASVPENITIPADGEIKTKLSVSAVKNQLGTEKGMKNSSGSFPYVKFELPAGTNGMRIEEEYSDSGALKAQYLVVNNLANVGTVDLKAICDPDKTENEALRFKGVEPYTKLYPIEVSGGSGTAPRIISSRLNGTVSANAKITLTYEFYQLNNDEDKSEITWLYSEDNVTYSTLDGVNGKSYTVPADKANGYFKVVITPKTENDSGTAVTTNPVGPASAPIAEDIKVDGKPFVGEELSATYTWYDINDDERGIDQKRWLRADSADGTYTAIDGAVGDTYTLTEADIDKYIKFEVTPVSTVEPTTGKATQSAAFEGPKAPTASNLNITKNNRILTANYDYHQAGGAPEGKSIYRWTVDGRVVSDAMTYVLPSDSKITVTLEITPISSQKPYEGKAESITMTFGTSGGSGGGGGGGSVGGYAAGVANSTGSLSPNTVGSINVPEKEKTAIDAYTDVGGHWGYEAIKWAADNGIMPGKTETEFAPNDYATRRETIEYMAKLLGFEGSEYSGIFADVDGDFAEILQTFVDKGIISVDTAFRPEDGLSRQELCKIFALALGISTDNAEQTDFSDNSEIGQWAIPYVNAMCESGFVQGVGENRFSPRGKVTRAQLATLLKRAESLAEALRTAAQNAADDAAEE